MHSPTDTLAQVRGGFVGAVSGAVSIAAHGMAGGGSPPGTGVVLLIAACVAIGAIVASVPAAAHRRRALVAALAAGQFVGHLTLTLVSEQISGHTHPLAPSAPMLVAHVAAVGVSAVLVRGAERGCRAAIAAVTRIVLAVLSLPPAEAPLWISTPVHRATLSPWLLAGATAGVRGPPLPV
ncbi:hypothetical protein [Rhodococcus phenolicus]|uniref:hypothetical protein n=1 Tax=Rhodococcus phenolicus TaxID=263849 RepID=UPI000830F2ED|nr:hypothetical protein [Rhodococcus phenolicus]